MICGEHTYTAHSRYPAAHASSVGRVASVGLKENEQLFSYINIAHLFIM